MSQTSNFQLEDYASKLHINLVSVVCKNELPATLLYGGFIINLNDSDKTNVYGHWTAFYTEKNSKGKPTACYFDSFGIIYPNEVRNYLKPCKEVIYSKTQIQNIQSGFCGIYCLYFLQFMQKNQKRIPNIEKRFKVFVDLFDDDEPEKNLRILKEKFDY